MLGVHTIQISSDLLQQVCDVDEFKGLWRGLDRHTTGLNLLGDVADYGAELSRVLEPLQQKDLNTDIVRILNAMQVGESGMYPFRDKSMPLPFSHGDKVYGVLDTAEPEQIEPLLAKLCEWVNDALKDGAMHPLFVAAVFAAVFLQIAPFDKGNLRTMRFLVVLILLKSDYTYAPYVALAPIMERKGQAMFEALRSNQESLEEGRPDWSRWLAFFVGALQEQKATLHERLYDREPELKDFSALSVKIMALFKEHKRLQMKEIITLTNGRRATIKLRLQELLEGGYLKRHGAGRSTWYSLV